MPQAMNTAIGILDKEIGEGISSTEMIKTVKSKVKECKDKLSSEPQQ